MTLWTENDWTFEKLEKVDNAIKKIADSYGLDYFPNQFDIISAEQMMDAYTSNGLPIMYHHWSFGKQFSQTEANYKRGRMGLAYEIVINSNPCISYLMEENSMTMQALVIAHAAYGHNSFFKGNYLFKQWTSPDSIVDYLIFAKNYITKCEEKYGQEAVEEILDACHALQHHGVDRYKKPKKLSIQKEKERQAARKEHQEKMIYDLWSTLPKQEEQKEKNQKTLYFDEPQENLLYFIEKTAPLLKDWQREIIRIVRKTAQYFYPQMQTKVMNEGWASFWHYTILNDMWEQGLISEGNMLEFLKSHTGVVFQPAVDDKRYSGINPYYLGFNMFMDIKRMCENPTEEDKKWFPNLVGKDWLEEIKYAMENFKDESFIQQYLSPKLIREMRLFTLADNNNADHYRVNAIHDEQGYKQVRADLAAQYDISNMIPDIQITDFDMEGDRTLFLTHFQKHHVPLDWDSTDDMLRHLHLLWGFDIALEDLNTKTNKVTEAYLFPE